MHVIQGIHSEKLREAIEKAAESTTEETDYARQYLHMKRKGVNGFIVVAAFIASIQALIVSFTKDSNKTAFETGTNIIGLFGIILDVTGAVLGATYVLVILNYIEDRYQLIGEIRRISKLSIVLNTPDETLADIEARFSDWERVNEEHWENEGDITEEGCFTTWKFLDLAEKISFGVMGLGVACLIVSVVMFSCSLGIRRIWIPCLVLAGAASTVAVTPLKTLFKKPSARERLGTLKVARRKREEARKKRREAEHEKARKDALEAAQKDSETKAMPLDEEKTAVHSSWSLLAEGFPVTR